MKKISPYVLTLSILIFSGCSFNSFIDFIVENSSNNNITISYYNHFERKTIVSSIAPRSTLTFYSVDTNEPNVDLSRFQTVPVDSFLIKNELGLPYKEDESDLNPWTKFCEDDYGYFKLTVRDSDF
ncbi:MAG: hypothetical protein HOP11_12035 [Saprospiraceae bacterium]|nr:hypothetical protein [Saprospiraceae bacterium]